MQKDFCPFQVAAMGLRLASLLTLWLALGYAHEIRKGKNFKGDAVELGYLKNMELGQWVPNQTIQVVLSLKGLWGCGCKCSLLAAHNILDGVD